MAIKMNLNPFEKFTIWFTDRLLRIVWEVDELWRGVRK